MGRRSKPTKPQPAMDISSQRFMAFHGLKQWARGVVLQRDRIEAARQRQRDIGAELTQLAVARAERRAGLDNIANMRNLQKEIFDVLEAFNIDRQLFLNAARQLLAYRHWVRRLGVIPNDVFKEFDTKAKTIKDLRDKNEHVIEWFEGKGLGPDTWRHSTADGTADASSTRSDLIGGRLSWNKLADIAQRLLNELPVFEEKATGAARPSFMTQKQ